jgi:hypothetical protein
MTSPKPYAGTSRSRLTLMLNLANGVNRVENVDFTYGNPVDEIDLPHGKNTSVILSPAPGSLYRGPVKIHYDRLDIGVLSELPAGSVRAAVIPSAPFWIRQHLDEINAALGLDLQPDEVINDYVPSIAPRYRLRIDGTKSHAWLESYYDFTAVRTSGERLPLELFGEVNGFGPTYVTPPVRAYVPAALNGFMQATIVRQAIDLYPEVEGFVPNTPDALGSRAIVPAALSGYTPAVMA